jgi:hypothetical protein
MGANFSLACCCCVSYRLNKKAWMENVNNDSAVASVAMLAAAMLRSKAIFVSGGHIVLSRHPWEWCSLRYS